MRLPFFNSFFCPCDAIVHANAGQVTSYKAALGMFLRKLMIQFRTSFRDGRRRIEGPIGVRLKEIDFGIWEIPK